jgi:hypothetical protein
MSQDELAPHRTKRERSTRYPGVPLAESVELARFIEGRGLDGLSAEEIAAAMGYKNIKTNTFSAKLSAARQFGLLALKDDGYALTPLARSILHPVDPAELPRLHRQALLAPPLYAELAEQYADKRLPDPPILGNVLYHHHQIIASAKQLAAETFLESARFAGALGEDLVFHPRGTNPNEPVTVAAEKPAPQPTTAPEPSREAPARRSSTSAGDVRIDLRLWGEDLGKGIRMRIPESITTESFDRLLQAIRLHVRIEEGPDEPMGEP